MKFFIVYSLALVISGTIGIAGIVNLNSIKDLKRECLVLGKDDYKSGKYGSLTNYILFLKDKKSGIDFSYYSKPITWFKVDEGDEITVTVSPEDIGIKTNRDIWITLICFSGLFAFLMLIFMPTVLGEIEEPIIWSKRSKKAVSTPPPPPYSYFDSNF